MQFEFWTSTRIIFGLKTLSRAGRLFKEQGKKTLIISGVSGQPIEDRLFEVLSEVGIQYSVFHVGHEPTIKSVQNALDFARMVKPDFVIGFGGGSSVDTGKAVAILHTNPGDIYDYLEVVGRGNPLIVPPMPMMAIPTTSGTGSEVTRNAVLEVEDQGVKVSLRSPLMYPKLSLIDPELMVPLPPEITAYTGLDALTQLIEPFVSLNANPLTDAICREGIKLVSQSLRDAFHKGGDRLAREKMALASLFGGIALANAKLGAVHGFAGPLGGMLHAPHGAICASLLPQVMEMNLTALTEREPGSEVIEKFTEIAHLLTGDNDASPMDGIQWIKNLCVEFSIPELGILGLTEDRLEEVVALASKASSMAGNPVKLTRSELLSILKSSM